MEDVEQELEKLSITNAEKLQLKIEISDVIFKQHIQHQNYLNICLCSMQIIILILNAILDLVFDKNVSVICCVCEIVLAIIISVNILIGEHTWKNAKIAVRKIDTMIDELHYWGDDGD